MSSIERINKLPSWNKYKRYEDVESWNQPKTSFDQKNQIKLLLASNQTIGSDTNFLGSGKHDQKQKKSNINSE